MLVLNRGFAALTLTDVKRTFTLFYKGHVRAVLPDLRGAALIREVHVYGQSLPVGSEKKGAAQHAGLGTRLLEQAESVARKKGYKRLAVISAVGTREYYLERGFERGELYLVKNIETIASEK